MAKREKPSQSRQSGRRRAPAEAPYSKPFQGNRSFADTQDEAMHKTLPPGEMLKIYGDSGTQRFSGYYREEYNPDWRDEQRIQIVEQMRRGDGVIKAVLRAYKAPMLAAKWKCETDSEDPEDVEICEFVNKELFGMHRPFKKFLREALAYLDFGHYAFELIWRKSKDGTLHLEDLAPRIPHSIFRWRLDDGRFGIRQLLRTNETEMRTLEVPAAKLLILTNEQEGDDVTGQSVLRPAYSHWVYKTLNYKIQGIAAERTGMGLPVVTRGENASEAEKAAIISAMQNLRVNETGYLDLPNKEWTFKFESPSRSNQGEDMAKVVEHHNAQIALSLLANFLQLGTQGSSGSYSLSQDLSSFFMKGVEDVCAYLAEEIDMQVIRRLVRANFGPRKTYPRLVHQPLGDIDQEKYTKALMNAAAAGVIDVDAKLKQYVHRALGLPEITKERMEAMEEADTEAELKTLEGAGTPQPDPKEKAKEAVKKNEKQTEDGGDEKDEPKP